MNTKFFTWALLIVMATMILAGCAGATPTAAPALPTQPVATKAPATTAPAAPQPAATAAPTSAAATPKKGGKITVAVWQAPTTLNPLLNTQTVENDVNSFQLDG